MNRILTSCRRAACVAAAAAMSLTLSLPADAAQTPDTALTQGYSAAVPNAAQYNYQKAGLSAFCHFGPNTFNEVEWGDRYGSRTPADIFPLQTPIDADGYVRTLKEAGFTRLIVTAKHHDGFCIWDSAYTDYDIASTNYPGDVLAELSAACTKYDLDMGLYLSPWDIHEPSYGYYDAYGNPATPETDALDYNVFYNNQLTEILSNNKYGNNGRFTEIWMDGAKGYGANAQDYDLRLWQNTIRTYEGDCLIFGGDFLQTVRWIGNERGYAADTTWAQGFYIDRNRNRVADASQASDIDINLANGFSYGYPDGNTWTVPECDARITDGWFWGTRKNTPKSINDLADMYYGSVGHNGVFLLNIPLNNQGKLDDEIRARVAEFGNGIRETFAYDLAYGKSAYASDTLSSYHASNVTDGNGDTLWAAASTSGAVTIDLGEETEFDIVSIEEAIRYGQRISSYQVECSNDGIRWAVMETGTTIGSKRLCRTGLAHARYLRVSVATNGSARPLLSRIGVFRGNGAFAAGKAFSGGEMTDAETYIFPSTEGETRTLEAETAVLFNTYPGTGTERYILNISGGDWASNGSYVDSCNEGDYILFSYDAPVAGRYEVTLSYRSGDPRNAFTITEENGRIEPVTVTAGAWNPYNTCTQTFSLDITEAGRGVLKLSAGPHKAPQMDKFDITLVKADRRFVFPDVTGNMNVLEAETATLFNTYPGTGTERYTLNISNGDWASGGSYVDSCNEGDYITFDYNAPAAGTYEVVLYYRSGDPRNSFTITEESGKIEPVTVSAGAWDPYVTRNAVFTLRVLESGRGTMVLHAGDYKAPQMDRFEITNR